MAEARGMCVSCGGQLSAHADRLCGACEQAQIDEWESDFHARPLPNVTTTRGCLNCGAVIPASRSYCGFCPDPQRPA